MTTATKTASAFRLEYAVAIEIAATPERIWDILTNAERFPAWNSTVTSIRGPIAQGTKLELRVPLAPDRAFKPVVTTLDRANHRMVWSDGFAPMFKGQRTFELAAKGAATRFSMREVFRGVMLPMIKGSLPDFTAAFETYANDLKREAERSA